MDHKTISLAVFVVSYILFAVLSARRTIVAIAASAVLIATNTISISDAFFAVNWNVMGIFVGTLIIADIFMESRVPAYVAEVIIQTAKSAGWAILFICLMTGVISAFVENVAAVLIVAPIALALAKKMKINPMNMMIAIAVSSNLQGTATLIGDPPSMLLGGFAKMNFMDFFFYHGRPSIFFAVEIGALASFVVLYFVFRRYKEKPRIERLEKVKSWIPTIILVGLIFLLALTSFLDTGFSYMAGLICMGLGIVSMIWERFVNKSSILEGIRSLDWDTTFFLMGVFVLVGSITGSGWIATLSEVLSKLVGSNIFLGYAMIVYIAVIFSAFVDNVPFLAAMLPVAVSMSEKLNIAPALFLFGLLIGASLGGNITPIGASANIVACGILKKEGHAVSFRDFMKIGVPFTLVAVTAAFLFIWFVWGK